MPAWILPLVTSALSAGGSMLGQSSANKQNLKIAREQMRFQERMSSTAAQRAVADFTKAGLNPALAYGNTASSPGGASATMGNVAEGLDKGISSALSAKATMQAMDIARKQSDADLALKQANTQESAARGATTLAQADLARGQLQALMRENQFRLIEQPVDLRLKALEAATREALLPRSALQGDMSKTARKLWQTSMEGYSKIGSYLPLLRSSPR